MESENVGKLAEPEKINELIAAFADAAEELGANLLETSLAAKALWHAARESVKQAAGELIEDLAAEQGGAEHGEDDEQRRDDVDEHHGDKPQPDGEEQERP